MTEVKSGQIWADNDPRSVGRTLRVDEVKFSPRMGKDVAVCTVLTNSDETQQHVDNPAGSPFASSGGYSDRRGKTTEIALKRFVPTSTGYRLISEA
jgi:hypothetical protein